MHTIDYENIYALRQDWDFVRTQAAAAARAPLAQRLARAAARLEHDNATLCTLVSSNRRIQLQYYD